MGKSFWLPLIISLGTMILLYIIGLIGNINFLFIGLVMFVLGIIVSTPLSTGWVIIGVLIAMIGGALIGISSH